MSGKRILAILSAVVVLGTAGYTLHKNSPYNNKNITFINRNLNDFSNEMEDFFAKDFSEFENIMYNIQNGDYDRCTYRDITALDRYMNIIMSCNFKDEGGDKWIYRDRYQSGFVIEFENYFPKGSEEWNLVERFSGYFEKIICFGYRYEKFNAKEIVESCTKDYHAFRNQIYQLPVFPRYIILKIIRPIIAENDSQYVTSNCFYYRDKVLAEIDFEISQCMYTMQRQCANPGLNYNVSRR